MYVTYYVPNTTKKFGQPYVAEFEKNVNRWGQLSFLFENKSEKKSEKTQIINPK